MFAWVGFKLVSEISVPVLLGARRAVEALKSHKAAQNAERLKAGSLWRDANLVFSTTTGKPLGFRNLATASFKPLLKKAGLSNIRFHDLRHACATLLLSRGHIPSWSKSFWDTPR